MRSFVLFSVLLFEFHFRVCICSSFPSHSTAGYAQECAVSSRQLTLLTGVLHRREKRKGCSSTIFTMWRSWIYFCL